MRHDSREIEYGFGVDLRRLQLPIDKDYARKRRLSRDKVSTSHCIRNLRNSQHNKSTIPPWMSLSFIAARSRFIVSGYFLLIRRQPALRSFEFLDTGVVPSRFIISSTPAFFPKTKSRNKSTTENPRLLFKVRCRRCKIQSFPLSLSVLFSTKKSPYDRAPMRMESNNENIKRGEVTSPKCFDNEATRTWKRSANSFPRLCLSIIFFRRRRRTVGLAFVRNPMTHAWTHVKAKSKTRKKQKQKSQENPRIW